MKNNRASIDLDNAVEVVKGTKTFLIASGVMYNEPTGQFIFFNSILINPPVTFWQKLKFLFSKKY